MKRTSTSCCRWSAIQPLRKHLLTYLLLLFALAGSVFSTDLYGQCNSSTSPFRYNITVTPDGMTGAQTEYCNKEGSDIGSGCCDKRDSYSCMDLVFEFDDLGKAFTEKCTGKVTLLTEQGNFDAAFYDVADPNDGGGLSQDVCENQRVDIGNNHIINVCMVGTLPG